MEGFSNISDKEDLAIFLDIPLKLLTYILYVKKTENCYQSFDIPKRSGGYRTINAPTDDLKYLQSKLSDALWKYQIKLWKGKNIHPNISHGFENGKSIFTNAKIHRNKRYVLNLDLKDFFNSFHFGRVRGFFEKNKNFNLPIEVATIIAQLTCYNGSLPQGAPSSPIITNMICNILDMRLLKIAKKYLVDYTRYADDLTFSTNNKNFLEKYESFLNEIRFEINKAGFQINDKKTRLQIKDSRQEVTGVIVNKKLNINNCFYKETRAMAHNLYKKQIFFINGMIGSLNQLEGRFSFINQFDELNNRLDGLKHDFRSLNGREEEYRKFLFYKYFYYNRKPIIVTEGKTDIVYLKAALKALYKNYPDLIEKNSDDSFIFKVSFFKRTKRIYRFFGIGSDGADSMKNLFNYFKNNQPKGSGFIDYYSYFSKVCPYTPKNPVILIFDNEITNKSKPLYNFINHVKLKETEKLEKDLYVNLIEGSNLFLTTNPLVKGLKECEIEDLFDDEVLQVNINGKTFCRHNEDTIKYFGKDIFSKYVYRNYKKISFEEFKPMLECVHINLDKSREIQYN